MLDKSCEYLSVMFNVVRTMLVEKLLYGFSVMINIDILVVALDFLKYWINVVVLGL